MTPEGASGGREDAGESITLRNFDMLLAHMKDPSTAESIGVNAHRETIDGKLYNAFAINGYADPATGEVVAYGNSQMIDEAVLNGGFAEFTLRLGIRSDGHERFIEVVPDGRHSAPLPPHVRRELERIRPLWDARADEEFDKFKDEIAKIRGQAKNAPAPDIDAARESVWRKIRKSLGF